MHAGQVSASLNSSTRTLLKIFPSNLALKSTKITVFKEIAYLLIDLRSRDSVLGTATRYGLEGPGIESRWDEIFRTYPHQLLGPPSLLYNGYRLFSGGKGGRGVMLTTYPF
jgi:hypothetical protein